MTRSRLRCVALLPLLVLWARADARGINPPRPSGSQVVEARCTERAAGNLPVLQRARVMAGGADGSIELQTGPSTPARAL